MHYVVPLAVAVEVELELESISIGVVVCGLAEVGVVADVVDSATISIGSLGATTGAVDVVEILVVDGSAADVGGGASVVCGLSIDDAGDGVVVGTVDVTDAAFGVVDVTGDVLTGEGATAFGGETAGALDCVGLGEGEGGTTGITGMFGSGVIGKS